MLGGEDISKVDPEALLKNFSIVFQEVVLFNTSIKENIRIGKKGATDAEIFEAAKIARCDEFIEKMPNGIETVIGENGERLSGGERQRISIARAILKDKLIETVTPSGYNTIQPIIFTIEGVLQIAAGHLPGSSLPVGGENTHSLISGHRGLPSAKLFTDIDKLKKQCI